MSKTFLLFTIRTVLLTCTAGLCFAAIAEQIAIGGGTFTMGNNTGEPDEQPEHQVTLSPYSIDKHEVTEAQYETCVASGKCTPAHYTDGKCIAWTSSGFRAVGVPQSRRNPDYPVVCVSWFQAREYCKAQGMRLPTEAQWEFAASLGKRSVYSWGDAAPSPQRCIQSSNQQPGKVCSFQTNAAGLSDMTGNVWEWTSDFYEKEYYSVPVSQDPSGPDAGLYRVIRGGGWYSGADQLRITNRHWFSPDFAEVSIGFRCVK